VTVCIAAITNGDALIVTASDTKLTAGYASQESGAIKQKVIHKRWRALIAGKFSQQTRLIEVIRASLGAIEKPSLADVEKACSSAYIEESRNLAYESILSKHGLDLEGFLNSRSELGDAIYERTWSEISRVSIGCDLLVCGFDEGDKPHIFVVTNPSDENHSFITHYDEPGFAAIGAGGYAAESVLYGYESMPIDPLAWTVYKVVTAKFMAESASDVGAATLLYVFGSSGERIGDIGLSVMGDLRRYWLKTAKPRLPKKFVDKLMTKIDKVIAKTSKEQS
jgi:hypothetical protein